MTDISTLGEDAVQAADASRELAHFEPPPAAIAETPGVRSRRAAPWAAAVATGFGIGLIVAAALLR